MQSLGTVKTQQKEQNINLEQRLRLLSTDINNCHIPIATLLKSEIDKNITANEVQHAVTRKFAETHITTAVENLQGSQAQRRKEQKEKETSQRQYDRFLESLRFADMNSRMNDVSLSHADTFQWMFEENIDHPWDNFAAWLRGGDHVYWIKGKPGSGKSTLMKFLAEDPQTRDMLAQWSPNKDVLIVATYFWLSGSRMQRNLKGFLCSVIRQIMFQDRPLFDMSFHADQNLLTKRKIDDWSNNELQQLVVRAIDLLEHPICMFIDGLDEFDQDDDVDKVLDLVERIVVAKNSKVCLSSRPEHYLVQRLYKYSQLQLQDVTARDMQKFIHDTLAFTRTQCRPSDVSDEGLERIVKTIAQKADGVFLWVHYALSSLRRGMRNDDVFDDLLDRVEELPSGMHQLYLQMWSRLNGDQQRYRDEARMYFSYEQFYSLPQFELLVALDPDLQKVYLSDFRVLDSEDLAQRCEALRNRVSTRCAGLLEAGTEVDSDQESSQSSSSCDTEGRNEIVENIHRSGTGGDGAPLYVPATPEINENFTDDATPNTGTDTKFGERVDSDDDFSFCRSRIRFLHRTARDFLVNSEEGRTIIGRPEVFIHERLRALARARMAALVQGLIVFDKDTVVAIMEQLRETHSETELLVTLRQVCQHLSVPSLPGGHIGYREFWAPGYNDVWPPRSYLYETFESVTARHGSLQYIQQYIQNQGSSTSPYYRGFLALCAVESGSYHFDPLCLMWKLPLASWLVSNGADIFTAHRRHEKLVIPACAILRVIYGSIVSDANKARKLAIPTLQAMLPLEKPLTPCVIRLSSRNAWPLRSLLTGHRYCIGEQEFIMVQMSVAKLFFLVIQDIERYGGFTLEWEYAPLKTRKEECMKVLFHRSPCDPFPSDVPAALNSMLKPIRHGFCPTVKDSLYLGDALERLLLSAAEEPATSRSRFTKIFETRLKEVGERSPVRPFNEWGLDSGWFFSGGELPENPYGVDPVE
ncbi:MAG: hypothetical protein Q9224_004725 [Gallowayella concinna]